MGLSERLLPLILSAIRDPAQHCGRMTSFPRPMRQMEPIEHWQARAVLAALDGCTDLLEKS